MTLLLENLWRLTLSAAPWLLLGLLMAGVVKALSHHLDLSRWLRGNTPASTVRAALIGAPLPLCSCGVVPAALGLRDSGAGRGPTVSFLIATPETGVDSISLSYGLLGPLFAVIRPIAAVTSAIGTGLIAGRWGSADPGLSHPVNTACGCGDSCGSKAKTAASAQPRPSLAVQLYDGMRYAFVDVLGDIGPWLLGGLVIAALAETFIPSSWFSGQWGYAASMMTMLLIGIPMYVCASASTPMAAGFLAAGMSPGAVLVFLLAGPATNIGTLAILRQALGMRTVVVYICGVMLSALAFGLGVDGILALMPGHMSDWISPASNQWTPESAHAWIDLAATFILGLLGLTLIWRKLQNRRDEHPVESCCGSKSDCGGP